MAALRDDGTPFRTLADPPVTIATLRKHKTAITKPNTISEREPIAMPMALLPNLSASTQNAVEIEIAVSSPPDL
jgi:hypothetical protein